MADPHDTHTASPHSQQLVVLRHHRTDQKVIVPARSYQTYARGRFRNWALARGNVVVRPITTLSQCVMGRHDDG